MVQQPFRCRGDLALIADGQRQLVTGGNDHAFILGQTREQEIAPAGTAQLVRIGQNAAMLLHLQSAEQFGAQRHAVIRQLALNRAVEHGQVEGLKCVPVLAQG